MIITQRIPNYRSLRKVHNAFISVSDRIHTDYGGSRCTFSSSTGEKKTKQVFDWKDSLLLREQLTEEERLIQDAANGFVEQNLMPRFIYYPSTHDGNIHISN